MKIEDYWIDKTIYCISFLSQENKKINRMIVLPLNIKNKKEVELIIMTKFNRVSKVLSIDEWGDALMLKNEKDVVLIEKNHRTVLI